MTDPQVRDRENETQLDAMRATIRRLTSERDAALAEIVWAKAALLQACAERDEARGRSHKKAPMRKSRPAKTVASRYTCGCAFGEHGPRGGCQKKKGAR